MQPNNIRSSLDLLLTSQLNCDFENLQHWTRVQMDEATDEMDNEPKMSLAVSKDGFFNPRTSQEITNNLKITVKDFFAQRREFFMQHEDDGPIDQSQIKIESKILEQQQIKGDNKSLDQQQIKMDNKSLFQAAPKTKKIIKILSQNKQKSLQNSKQPNPKYINKNKNIMRDICSKCALYIQTNPRAVYMVTLFVQQDEENKKLMKRQIQNLRKINNFQQFRSFYGRDEQVIEFIKDLTIKFYNEDAFVYIMNSQIAYRQQTINQIGYFKHYINNLENFNQYRKWEPK